jgi:hypothetical protein
MEVQMADIKDGQKYRTHGYFNDDAFESSHPQEWAAYLNATTYRDKALAKSVMKEIIKGLLGLPAGASIDYQRFGGRWRVDENLVPPKARRRANDLTELFKKKARPKL